MNKANTQPAGRYRSLRVGAALVLLVAPVALQACDAGTPSTAGTPTPVVERAPGEATYMRYCNVCHPGGGLGAGPSLKELDLSYGDLEDIIRHGKGRMPGFGTSSITGEELEDLVDYVMSLSE
jgi:mono/diheme cytochrome c family protein